MSDTAAELEPWPALPVCTKLSSAGQPGDLRPLIGVGRGLRNQAGTGRDGGGHASPRAPHCAGGGGIGGCKMQRKTNAAGFWFFKRGLIARKKKKKAFPSSVTVPPGRPPQPLGRRPPPTRSPTSQPPQSWLTWVLSGAAPGPPPARTPAWPPSAMAAKTRRHGVRGREAFGGGQRSPPKGSAGPGPCLHPVVLAEFPPTHYTDGQDPLKGGGGGPLSSPVAPSHKLASFGSRGSRQTPQPDLPVPQFPQLYDGASDAPDK